MEVISSIQKQRGGYYLILFDNGYKAKVPQPLLKAFPLKANSAVSLEDYFIAHKKEAFKFAAGRAAYLLQKKDYTVKEMGYKLTYVGYPQNIVDELLQYLLEKRFLNDTRYAENYVKRKISKYGANRIKQDLLIKGIDKSIAEEVLEQHICTDESLNLATQLAKKYIAARINLEPHKLYNNTIAMLVRKGFDYSEAKEAYKIALSSLER